MKNIYIEVYGNKSLVISDDGGGYRLAGPKVGGVTQTHQFKIDPHELMRELQSLMDEEDEDE